MHMLHLHLWASEVNLCRFQQFKLEYYYFLILPLCVSAFAVNFLIRILYIGDTIEGNAIKTMFSDRTSSSALAFSSTKVKLQIFYLSDCLYNLSVGRFFDVSSHLWQMPFSFYFILMGISMIN